MAIPLLPVWSIRPNWAQGILERLEWLTDVLPSTSGAEQRRSLRLSPRRSIEITVNPTQAERTFLDLILHSMGGATWLFPLWFDKGRLSATATAGQKRIAFDNTFREFRDNGLALIYHDAFSYEVVEIASQDDTGINTVDNLGAQWSKGSAIYPLRRAFFPDSTSLDALTSRVGEAVLLFQVNEDNDYPEIMPDVLYNGVPIMHVAPNRKTTITTDHTRMINMRDGTTGLVQREDNTGRSFSAQGHGWMIVGREAQAQFRSMLYWMRGRQRMVWLPTFNDDVTLSRPALAGTTDLDINRVGMGYVGGVQPGRDRIRFGDQVVALTDMGSPQSAQEERLRLAAPLATAIPKGRSGSFMDAARLDSDTLELHHHADTNGVLECATTFRAFKDSRVVAGPVSYPIPDGVMSAIPCGSPDRGNPCAVAFPGWYWKVTFRLGMSGGTSPYTFYDHYNEGPDAYYGDGIHILFEEVIPWQRTFYLGTDYPDGFVTSSLQQLGTENLVDGGPTMTEPVDVGDGVMRPMFHVTTQYWNASPVDTALGAQTRLPTPWVFPLILGD